MKPNSGQNDRRREPYWDAQKRLFPITDCNYQSFSFNRYFGGPERNSSASFLNISRDYFRYEARRNFLVEAAFFLALTAILVLTLISGAVVIIQFLNLPEA